MAIHVIPHNYCLVTLINNASSVLKGYSMALSAKHLSSKLATVIYTAWKLPTHKGKKI